MIKVEKSKVCFEGALETLCAEMVQALRGFKRMLVANVGQDSAEKLFSEIVKDSQKTPEELMAEIEELLREKFGEFGGLLVQILGKAGKEDGTK